ncbi:TPA: glucan-binding protein [Mannheimia haemolytica]|nr:alpha/beta fold hydrolase [Mannheimia haemolytica]
MRGDLPLFMCKPIAIVNELGAQIEHFEITFSSRLSHLEITELDILICSENTQNLYVPLKIKDIKPREKNKFDVFLEHNIFDKQTKLFLFDEVKFCQIVCKIHFKVELSILENGTQRLLSEKEGEVLPIFCSEKEKFIHSTFGDINYSLFTPISNDKKHPLIICLHGAGEGGKNQSNILADMMATTFLKDKNTNLFDNPYILAPQCPSFWLDRFELNNQEYIGLRDYTYTLNNLTEHILDKYQDIDRNRIYLIGASMGGYQALRLVSCSPHLFAAAIISCPAKIPKDEQLDYINIPIWFIHSELDRTVPISNTEYIVNYIQKRNVAIKKTYCFEVFIQNKEIDPHCVFLNVYNDSINDRNISIFEWLTTQYKE